jgi:predicted ATP-grasp superfamily ATP-dependent carboligase
MASLTPVFNHASGALYAISKQAVSAHESTSGEQEALTLEFNEHPFRAFIKELELLTKTDPQEALRLIELAIMDQVFDKKMQLEKLQVTKEEIEAAMQLMAEQKPNHAPYMPQHLALLRP